MNEFILLYFGLGAGLCVVTMWYAVHNRRDFIERIDDAVGWNYKTVSCFFIIMLFAWLPIVIMTLLNGFGGGDE